MDAAATTRLVDPADIDHSLDSQSRSSEIIIILTVFSLFSAAVVSLRVYTRAQILRSFGIDDAVIVVALLLTIGAAVAIGLEGKFGLGTHTWVQPLEDFIPYMKSFYVSIILYNVALCLIKVSILLQYRRIFTQKTTQWISGGFLTFIVAWTVTLSVLLPLVCYPVHKFWEPERPGYCVNQLAVWYVMAGVNIVTDFAIFIIPLPVVKSLQLPTKQKILLVFVFGLGLFTCVISVLRIRTLKEASLTSDPNWDNTDAALWSFIELCIGVLTSSLPTLRPMMAVVMPRYFGSSATRGYPHRYYNDEDGTYASSRSRAFDGGMGSKKRPAAHSSNRKSMTDSLEELHHQYGGNGNVNIKDLEFGFENDLAARQSVGIAASNNTAPIYSVNVSGGHDYDSFELRKPPAAAVPAAIVKTTAVTRRYEPSSSQENIV